MNPSSPNEIYIAVCLQSGRKDMMILTQDDQCDDRDSNRNLHEYMLEALPLFPHWFGRKENKTEEEEDRQKGGSKKRIK
jgi:hypothetical protein